MDRKLGRVMVGILYNFSNKMHISYLLLMGLTAASKNFLGPTTLTECPYLTILLMLGTFYIANIVMLSYYILDPNTLLAIISNPP